MKACSILIPNRWTGDAICLTIESILKRTNYPDYKIIVCDNSEGKGNTNRVEYLKEMEANGHLKLIENSIKPVNGKTPYGHGENLKVLLRDCDTPLAMLLSSGCEIKDPDWLNQLVELLDTDKYLGVAKTKAAENHFNNCWAVNRYVPNWMLLNMEIYRKFGNIDEDWELKRVPYDEYEYKYIFSSMTPPSHPDPDPIQVFLDTGWRLWDRLHYENPEKYMMADLPAHFPWRTINFFGGIDRNYYRPDHPYVVKMKNGIKRNLELLRKMERQ